MSALTRTIASSFVAAGLMYVGSSNAATDMPGTSACATPSSCVECNLNEPDPGCVSDAKSKGLVQVECSSDKGFAYYCPKGTKLDSGCTIGNPGECARPSSEVSALFVLVGISLFAIAKGRRRTQRPG